MLGWVLGRPLFILGRLCCWGNPLCRAGLRGAGGKLEASQWLQHQPIDRRPNVGAWLPGLVLPVGRFKIPPMEAAQVLPQQALALEAAKQATEDPGAGWQESAEDGRTCNRRRRRFGMGSSRRRRTVALDAASVGRAME